MNIIRFINKSSKENQINVSFTNKSIALKPNNTYEVIQLSNDDDEKEMKTSSGIITWWLDEDSLNEVELNDDSETEIEI